jgi:integrase
MEVSFYLTRSEEGKQTAIYAHIRYGGHRFKYYLSEKIDPQFWNIKEQQAKKTNRFPGYMELNRRLGKIYDRIKDIHSAYRNNNDNKEPAPDVLRADIDREFKEQPKKGQRTFLSFFQELVDNSISGSRVQHATGKPFTRNTIKSYTTALNHLKKFQAVTKRKIDFENINIDFHADYTEFLIKTLKLSANSIGKDFKNIKTVMAEATERGLNINLQFKSRKFSVSKEDTTSIYLNQKELEELAALDLTGNQGRERVRDLFLIGCFTGLRFSDFSVLRIDQITAGFIEINQVKTGGGVVIPVHPVVKGIIERYNGQLPKGISNQKTNEALKDIGKQLKCLQTNVAKTFTKGGSRVIKTLSKWELLSTHTARRSFATNEYLAGTPTMTIMKITGHQTEKAFMKYIKLTSSEHAQKLKDLWAARNQLKAV